MNPSPAPALVRDPNVLPQSPLWLHKTVPPTPPTNHPSPASLKLFSVRPLLSSCRDPHSRQLGEEPQPYSPFLAPSAAPLLGGTEGFSSKEDGPLLPVPPPTLKEDYFRILIKRSPETNWAPNPGPPPHPSHAFRRPQVLYNVLLSLVGSPAQCVSNLWGRSPQNPPNLTSPTPPPHLLFQGAFGGPLMGAIIKRVSPTPGLLSPNASCLII